METAGENQSRAAGVLSWAPLFLGAINSYGPINFNYGFALYFLTYEHGFVKRGLVGELLSPVHWLPRTRLMAAEYLFLAIAFALTYVVFRTMLFGDAAERRLSAALLSAPALLPHIGYLFAQPDVTLYTLLLLCVWLFVRTPGGVAAAASCALCCLALLGHEAFCLMFYPLIAAILLHLVLRRRMDWAVAVVHVVIFASAFVAVMQWGALKVSSDTIVAEAQARTDVGIQRQLFDVMASTFAEQEALVRRMYSREVIRVLIGTVVLTTPYVWLLVGLVNGTLRNAGAPAVQRVVTMMLFASPLLLCALGHDTTRWMSAMCIDATLFILFVYLTEAEGSAARGYLRRWATGPSFAPWLVYLVGIGPYGATGLRTADQIISVWYGP
jgi:hypothetical protein